MAKENVAKNYFAELNAVDVSDYIEKKNGLSYVSWANAWKELKKRHPDAFYTIYESENGRPYFTDGRTCWVKTGVTVEGIEHIEYLPVMDYRNQSIGVDRITSMDMNKSIQRSLTKACARHGLGLYVYAGEDLPEDSNTAEQKAPPAPKPAAPKQTGEKKQEDLFQKPSEDELEEAFQILLPDINSTTDIGMLKKIHESVPGLHEYKKYKDAMNKRYKELQK